MHITRSSTSSGRTGGDSAGIRYTPVSTLVSPDIAAHYTRALQSSRDRPPLSPEQEQYMSWAHEIIESSRVQPDRTIAAYIPGRAGDSGAVYALDFFYRWKTGKSLQPGQLDGAVDFTRLEQTLSSDYIVPPQPEGTECCRKLSVRLDPPETARLRYVQQRSKIEALGGAPATPIEQPLGALILRCRTPERAPFRGIIRGSERGTGLVFTELYGIRVVTNSDDAGESIFMSISSKSETNGS